MSADNQEFSIPFEESRRGANSSPEQKAALGRLGRYLGSRAVNRPTIGERRRGRGGRDFDLPTGGKPGTRNPTGSRRDVDGDGWADEGTSRPVWVGVEGQGGKPASPARRSARRERTPQLSSGADYMGQHQAPDRENGAPLHELTANGIYPDDIYASNALEMYGFGGDFSAEALSIASSAKGKPKKQIKIYRAVPLSTEDEIRGLEKQAAQILRRGRIPNSVTTPLDASGYYNFVLSEIERLKSLTPEEKIKINSGDWVTPVRGYAVSHGRSHLNNKYKIISKTVPASHLFTDGNSIEEWGYDPGLPSRKKNEQGSILSSGRNDERRGRFLPKGGREQGDLSESLSSGVGYELIVAGEDKNYPTEKSRLARRVSQLLDDEELAKVDEWITSIDAFGDEEYLPKPNEPRKALKQKITDAIVELFGGEIELRKDLVVTAANGEKVNLGNKVKVVVYESRVDVDELDPGTAEQVRELQLYDNYEGWKDGEILKQVSIWMHIVPTDEAAARLSAAGVPDDLLDPFALTGDTKAPHLGRAQRTINLMAGEKQISHDVLFISEQAQGYGIASQLNARNEKIYRDMGIQRILTEGSSSGESWYGATHWPRNGFTWAGEKHKQEFIGLVDEAIKNNILSDEEKQRISALYAFNEDSGFFETSASPEELIDFEKADSYFQEAEAGFLYKRDIKQPILSSGKSRDENVSTSIVEQKIIDEDDPEFFNSDGDFDADAYNDAIYDNVEKIRESFYKLQKEADDSYKKLSKEKYPDGKVPQRFAEAKIQMDKVFGDSDLFGEPEPIDRSLVVARDADNNIVGAARFRRGNTRGDDNLFIHHVASYGKESGIDNLGSSIFRDILKIANDDNTGITLESTPGSKEYWESMGFRDVDPEKLIFTENAYLAMSSEKVRELYNDSGSTTDSQQTLSSGRNVSELYDGEYGTWQEGEQLTPDSLSRLISMVFEENDVDASLPKYEGALESLDDYKEFGYGVNDLLRSWDGQSYLTFDKPQNSELGQYQSMQRLLMDNRTTAGITLYRAITRRPEIENLQEGDVFGDRGFQSFSLMSPGQYTGQGSKRPIVLRLLTTKNTRGRYISRRPRDYDFSNTDKTRQEAYFGVNEHEMLLPAGATYKLVKKTKTDDGREIWDVKLSKQGVLSSGAKEVKLDNVDPETLSSGKAPRYPRTPTLGAFLGKADEDFADIDSWEEFKRLYDDKEVVFFDYETTGLLFDEFGKEVGKGSPVQFGAVKIKNGKEVGRINLFMNPDELLGEWSRNNLKDQDGNPLTDEWLASQMSIEDAHRQLIEFAGPEAIFGVQNATFDKAVLDGVLEQMGEDWRPSGYLDTREIAALTLPKWTPENEDGPFTTDREGNKKPSTSLAAITEYLGVDLGDGHHNADIDAFATSQVMQRMIDGAIEKGWSKDALSKEKRDSLYQETVDKFNVELEKFEKDKTTYSESLSSGVRLSEVFEEEISPLDENAGEADELGKTIKEQARDIVARRVISAIEKAQNIELNDGQKRVIESIVPDIVEEVKNKTLLDVELDAAFQDSGEILLKSISVDVSSDGTPFVSADPIPQLAEQIPSKRDWRSIEIPKIDDVVSVVDETSKKGTVFFRNNVWYDSDENIVARKGFAEDGSTRLEYENDEARARFPLLEFVAPKGYVIPSDRIGLSSLRQGTLPGGYEAAWKKHGDFLMELGRRAGEMMGDEGLFMRSSRKMHSTNTFLNGYIGGLTNPSKFNLGLDGEAQQYYHDLFGHLGTGRGFDRHGEWANDIAMMTLVDHPDSPLTPQEKLAVKHLHYMMYSSSRLIFIGRADEIDHPRHNIYREFPRNAFDINPLNSTPTSMAASVYAGDFNEVVQKLTDASPGGLSSGRKPIYDAEERDVELAVANDALGFLAAKGKDGEALQNDETAERSSTSQQYDFFKKPLRPIRPRKDPIKKPSPETMSGRVASDDSLYDEAYGPIRTTRRTRTPQARGIGETEYDAILEMVDFDRRKKKLRKASFSYGPDEFEKTLQWTKDNTNREVDIKIMSEELEVPLSNAYFFIGEFSEIFERLESAGKGRQKYRIRTPQEIKDYLSSGRISDNEKTSYKIKNNARNYLLNQEERPIGLMSEYRARYEYYDGYGYAGRRLGSHDESGFNQEAFEQASEDVFGKRFDTFEEMVEESSRLQDLFKEDENYREKIKQESIEKHGYAYSPIYKNGELTAYASIDVYDDELAYNSLYNLLLYMQRGRDGQTATRNTLKKLLKDIEESNEKKNKRFKTVRDENGSRYKLFTFDADLKKLESEELRRLTDKYKEEGMSLLDAVNRAISDLKNDERFSDDKMYLDDGNQSLSSGRQRPLVPMRRAPERRPAEPGKRGVKGYGQADASGKEVRRSSTKWLAGMTSEEMSLALVPSSKEEHFEMWADDLAGTGWNKDRKYRKYLKQYYDQLDGHENALRIDYSPEGLEASRELVRSMLDSSPQMKWMFENFGAPLIGVFTRDAMNEYEGRPDVKERMELLRQQRGMEKTPFVSGLASREFGFVGLTPRALIDRESYDNVGAKYPLELDPNRKPGLREAHIDRSLHGTLIHEYGHWLHYRAIRDLETNSSGGSKTYYGSGKLDDPMYRAALDVAEEYANPDTDNEAIEIYSQFIDLTGRDAGEMFKAHPDKALLATSYGNVNKREAIAEAFVAIMHPNKDLAKNVLSPKLRRDIYALAGVDPDNIPWEARPDGRPSISMSLSSGAEAKPGREKRRGRISRALRQLVGADEDTETQEEPTRERYEFEAPQRPDGLVSFASEPSEELRESLPVPPELALSAEIEHDVKLIPSDPILEEMSKGFKSNQIGGFGVGLFASVEDRKASAAAKRMISLYVSQTADIDPIEFIESFSTENLQDSELGNNRDLVDKFFGAARNFRQLQEVFNTVKALGPDATDEEKAKAGRFAVNRTNGSIVPADAHDKIIQRRFYYDEMIDVLESKTADALFGEEWDELTRLRLGDEKSIFTPYVVKKVGGADITKDLLERAQQTRSMLREFVADIKGDSRKTRDNNTGRALGDNDGFVVIFSPIGDVDPVTGKQNTAIVSRTGTVSGEVGEWLKALIRDGKIVPSEERTQEQRVFYERLKSNYGLTDSILGQIADAGMTIVDSSNVDSDEVKELFKRFLIERMRAAAGNAEAFKLRYQYESGVSFFDIGTPEGIREAKAAIVSDVIHTWAISANDSNPVALTIQHEARKMFGLDEAVGWYGRVRGAREGAKLDTAISIDQISRLGPLEFDDVPQLSEVQSKLVSSIIKAIYESTQHYYKSKGITHVAVWRGMRATPEMTAPRGELVARRTTMRPLSSWTTNSAMAQSFATSMGGWVDMANKKDGLDLVAEQEKYDENLLIKAFVPVEQIFSNPLTGFGCLGEDEVVLLGRPTDTIMITPPATFLPTIDENIPAEQQQIVRDIIAAASERDKQINPAYWELAGLGRERFAEEFASRQPDGDSSGASKALSSGAQLSPGKVIKYNWIDARMRAADMKITFNRDPERVAAVKSTLAKGFMGGFTVEVDRMDDIKEGIAIARNKHGMKVDAVADFDAEGNPSDELVDTFLAWMDFHGPKTFMEPKPGAEKTTIGGWVSDGTVYLDVVDVYPNTEENIAKAADMGMSEDQIAVTNLNRLWELLEKGEDPSPAFIDSGGTGGFTLDEESVRRVSAAMSEIKSNKFNTGSSLLKRIGNTKKYTKGPITGARRVRYTDFKTNDKRDYWIVSGENGIVKVFTQEQYINMRDKKIQGLFDKMSTQSNVLASMFEARNIKPVASMSFPEGKTVGEATISKNNKNLGLSIGMAHLYGFANNINNVGVRMGDKIIAAMA